MRVAKRYVVAAHTPLVAAADLLAAAAALDYVLLIATTAPSQAEGAEADMVRETTTRAVAIALDFTERMLRAPAAPFEEFAEHHLGAGGLFDIVRGLRECCVITSTDIAFRAVTLGNDVAARRGAH